MLGAGLTVLAYEEYSSSKVAGAFFAAFGLGAVLGSIVAVRIVGRYDPLRLGASAFVILTLPIFALSLELPVPAGDDGARRVVVLRPARQRAAHRRDHDAHAGGDPRQGDDRRPHDGDARRARRHGGRRPAARSRGGRTACSCSSQPASCSRRSRSRSSRSGDTSLPRSPCPSRSASRRRAARPCGARGCRAASCPAACRARRGSRGRRPRRRVRPRRSRGRPSPR